MSFHRFLVWGNDLTQTTRHFRQSFILVRYTKPIDCCAISLQVDKGIVWRYVVQGWSPVCRHVIDDLGRRATATSGVLVGEVGTDFAWTDEVVYMARNLSKLGISIKGKPHGK